MKISPICINNFGKKNSIITCEKANVPLLLAEDSSADIYDMYMDRIRSYKRLTRKEERKLAQEIKKGGQEALSARNELIKGNLRLVVKIALNNKKKTSMPIMDLIQEGNLGLYRATESYNGQYAFSTYATPWINEYMRRANYEKYSFIKIPITAGKDMNSIKRYIDNFYQKNGREPSIEEISQGTAFSPQKIKNLLQCNPDIISLNTQILDNNRKRIEINDTISDKNSILPYEYSEKKSLQECIEKILSLLSDGQREILILNFGLFDTPQLTQTEIAEKLNVSRQAIQNRIKNALEKITKNGCVMLEEMRDEGLKDKPTEISLIA